MFVTAACIAVVLAWFVGTEAGAKKERAHLADTVVDQRALIATMQSDHDAALKQLQSQRDLSEASHRDLQIIIKEMEAAALEQDSANRLYERIEGVDKQTGLAIDTVELIPAKFDQSAELHITVVQQRGRDRVSGKIGLALVGVKDGSNWREIIVEPGSPEAPGFELRFFQTLVVALPEANLDIEIVEISVVPKGKRHKPFTDEQDWERLVIAAAEK